MGFWKVSYSTVRNAGQRFAAGVSEALHSTTEKLTETVTNICRSSYERCCAAVRTVDDAVRAVREKIPKEYVDKIKQILMDGAICRADEAIRVFLKGYPILLAVYEIARAVLKSQ